MENLQVRKFGEGTREQEQHLRSSEKARACVLCRQQKLKCDLSKNPSKTCTRCAKSGVPCHFSSTFERKKARSKAALQREIDMLRNQVPISQVDFCLQTHQKSSEPQSTDPRYSLHTNNLESPLAGRSSTTIRSIDGINVEQFKINDCFSLFFKHYHPMLPILDPAWDLDECFRLSPFVFWSIVITGARRYEADPTILDRLTPSVRQLALNSMANIPAYFSTICGLLILCAWPLPMKSVREDPSPMYAGAAMQLALQHGLHMFNHTPASTRPSSPRDPSQDASLARVWAYLEFVCHCTSWTTGSPPHVLVDAFDLQWQTGEMTHSIPPSICWMQKFEKLCTRATMTLTDMTCVPLTESSAAMLSGLITHFDEQILQLSQNALADVHLSRPESTESTQINAPILPNPLIVAMSRIHVNAFHFLGCDITAHLPGLIELYHKACDWTQQASEMDRISDWALYSSESYFRHTILVATIILRIAHSEQLKTKVDLRAGERAYFTAVRLMKRRSLQSGDVNAHCASKLSELWHSEHCFMLSDGSHDSLKVHSRAGGVMGIAYDCLSLKDTRQNHHARMSAQPPVFVLPKHASDGTVSASPALHAPSSGQALTEVSYLNESEWLDMADTSSFDMLYNDFQWAQDDHFWI